MLLDIQGATDLIRSGKRLLLAGEEEILLQLPKGDWIGGTIPYFMSAKGGASSRTAVFVNEVPAEVGDIQIVTHDAESISAIAEEAPGNGCTFLILPASSDVHLSYAQEAPTYPEMFMKPIIGWISGVHLDELGTMVPKVVDGRTVEVHENRGVAMHCTLPEGKAAQIDIVNLFEPGDGDVITFPEDGFSVTRCVVNGESRNFAEYVDQAGIDIQLPLVADYSGAMVNVSFQSVNSEAGRVELYAPVFAGVEYRIAAPVEDYVAAFERALPEDAAPVFTCNCILNYLYGSLEGKVTKGMYGPVTFGEIAYQLLNQTLVYLSIR